MNQLVLDLIPYLRPGEVRNTKKLKNDLSETPEKNPFFICVPKNSGKNLFFLLPAATRNTNCIIELQISKIYMPLLINDV